MKTYTLAVAFVLGAALAPALAAAAQAGPAAPAAAAPAIAAAEAKTHIGQTVTVEAPVSGVHHARSGSEVMLDISGKYPNNALTAVVFKSDLGKFSNLDALNGKTVRLTGALKLYRGKPEIVLSDPAQIRPAA